MPTLIVPLPHLLPEIQQEIQPLEIQLWLNHLSHHPHMLLEECLSLGLLNHKAKTYADSIHSSLTSPRLSEDG